jgi:NAD-dependent dihydropyrimidine dehydrogenase PreA subunit
VEDPPRLIDCGACEPACPVTAIFEEATVPAEWKDYIQLNARYFAG